MSKVSYGRVPARVVPPRPRPLPAVASAPPRSRVARRVAAGALLSAVFVGGTAGTALAGWHDVPVEPLTEIRPAGVTPTVTSGGSVVKDVAFTGTPLVVTWPSASSTKSTAVRLVEENQGVVHREGTATRIAVVWAVAATVATAGILAGSLFRRRELRLALSRPAPVRLDAWRRPRG